MTTQRSSNANPTARQLMAQASEQTGLSDFGDHWFLGPLNQVLDFARSEAGLNSADDSRAQRLVSYLCDRLRMVEHLKCHPEIQQEKLDVRGVIIGHARGGSTMLQRLVGSSPQLTSCLYWEMMQPIPLPDEAPGDRSARQKGGEKVVNELLTAIPDMRNWHPLDANQYDEEIHFLDRTFLSTLYSSYFYFPGYSVWITQQDHSKAYEELVLWLKILQHQEPERRNKAWLLKSPHHFLSGSLQATLDAFPDARIFMTHRRIEDLIPSVCSISAKGLRGFGNAFDEQQLGPQYIDIYRRALDIMYSVRDRAQPGRFVDLRYKDILKDPLASVHLCLTHLGLEPGPADEAAAREWLAANQRESRPPHDYSAEAFGITNAQLAEVFADYHARFL